VRRESVALHAALLHWRLCRDGEAGAKPCGSGACAAMLFSLAAAQSRCTQRI